MSTSVKIFISLTITFLFFFVISTKNSYAQYYGESGYYSESGYYGEGGYGGNDNGGGDNYNYGEGNYAATPIPAIGTICGYVYQDSNTNGTYDSGDIGLWAKDVTLAQANNTPIATGKTDATGHYCFGPLQRGNFRVIYTTPSGYSATSPSNVHVTIQ